MYTVRMLEAWLHCFLTETERFFLKAIGGARARAAWTRRPSAPTQATSQKAEHNTCMSTRVVVRLIATNHDSTQPLHEIRVSPGTLLALGASCYSWLLLGDDVPCFASVEPTIDEGVAVVPEVGAAGHL